MESIDYRSQLDVVEIVRNLRNDLIKDFLDERHLKAYIADKFNIKELSTVRVEFIKKDLKELLLMPVDQSHYKPLLDDVSTHSRTSLAEGNEQLFYKELDHIFVRHIF
ncbi:MAG: hypothetical protein HC859_07975 [Bacteroidia bacterium]|nr:hypothetical protein [Bacteroidia bacterium]